MKQDAFYIVDVFAEKKYPGNQLAVVMAKRGSSSARMQSIAKEMGFSETVFLLSREKVDGGFPVRIFTPEQEIPFAGHPVLGAVHIILRELEPDAVDEMVFLPWGGFRWPGSLRQTAARCCS
jgi:trans-2,3-dihydro-3-hydroxyanthranilate isomerase